MGLRANAHAAFASHNGPLPIVSEGVLELNQWDQRRNIWQPEWETEVVNEVGREWPSGILVTKWERNMIGEKRYVDTKWYYASQPQIINLGENASPEDVETFRREWKR